MRRLDWRLARLMRDLACKPLLLNACWWCRSPCWYRIQVAGGGLEALIQLGEGDMRRTLNLLQVRTTCTASGGPERWIVGLLDCVRCRSPCRVALQMTTQTCGLAL